MAPPRTIAGRFRLEAELGRGGMATVWRARDETLRRDVALKLMSDELAASPDARRRFTREAHAAALLDHPGIITIHDSGDDAGCLYIAMQLVDGETVWDRVRRSLLPPADAVRIACEAAAALAHAHARGVTHRDVTPRNIMLARDGRVIVLDFGLATATDVTRLTQETQAFGTWHYVAPEVIRAETRGERDPRLDIYSLGVVLYEMLTGTTPFAGDRPQAVIASILQAPVRAPSALRPNVPAALDAVVLRMMARDLDVRYGNCAQVVADLRAAVGADAYTGVVAPAPPVAAATAESPRYLAILPFVDEAIGSSRVPPLSGADASFAHGLAHTLASALAHVPDLRVIPPRAADAQARDTNPSALALSLGANCLLLGRVRRSGMLVRVTYSLIDAYAGHQLAGDVVDGSADDVFALENDLVERVTRALGASHAARFERARRPRDPAARERFLQALGYLQRPDNEAAIDGAIGTLERLVETEGESAEYLAVLARAYLAKGALTKQRNWESRAASAGHRSAELDPNAPDVLVTLGDLLESTGRPIDAIDAYRRALVVNADLPEAELGLARAFVLTNRFDDAVAAAQRAIALRPGDWRGYRQLGSVYFHNGKYARAAEPWRTVTQIAPDNAWGHGALGAALLHMDRFEEALESFERAVRIHPTAEGYWNVGAALFYLQRFEEAAGAFERATALAPSDPVAWGNKGAALGLVESRRDEARDALERACSLMEDRLRRHSGEAEDWARLADWSAMLGRSGAALEASNRALALRPDDLLCLRTVACAYLHSGQRDTALALFRDIVRRGYGVRRLLRDPHLASIHEEISAWVA